jgi:hypothetical protein
MFDGRRPLRRFFYLQRSVLAALTTSLGQTPATTTISDVVYRADGTRAGGTTADLLADVQYLRGRGGGRGQDKRGAGARRRADGALVPNVGATPSGTFYTVVYQVDDGTVKTEFWVVGTNSPTTISAVRTVLGSGGSAIGSVGSGLFVKKAGDTMTGPLQLASDPSALNQASTKHYVNNALTSKADLAEWFRLRNWPRELQTTACAFHGDSTWGVCGSSGNAVSIQNVPVDTTAPGDNQVITYVASSGKHEPRAGGGVTAGMAVVKYSPDFNWWQSPATNLNTPGAVTVNLAVCPPGVTGNEPQYYVYISGTGTAEAALVTGGTCSGNGQPGRLKQAEERITFLEKSEIRRSVYDRIRNAVITVLISAAIAMHDRWGIK